MAKILINDGLNPAGLKMLADAGFEVVTTKIAQEELMLRLQDFDAICVRSATQVRADLIDACPNLKLIGRGGVGMDNIDVDYAKSKGIVVVNTPAASSRSVAELAFAHLFSISRFLYKSNRSMPAAGSSEFDALKNSYSKGFELEGKTIGIIGGGRIGQETGKIAISLGMQVIFVDPFIEKVSFDLKVYHQTIPVTLNTVSMAEMLPHVDIISLHIPFTGKATLGKEEFSAMKSGVILINASRGGTVDEDALLDALNNQKVAAAGIDVYENEPTPRADLISHPNVSCTPHIGASTNEAQTKIGTELAQYLIDHLS